MNLTTAIQDVAVNLILLPLVYSNASDLGKFFAQGTLRSLTLLGSKDFRVTSCTNGSQYRNLTRFFRELGHKGML